MKSRWGWSLWRSLNPQSLLLTLEAAVTRSSRFFSWDFSRQCANYSPLTKLFFLLFPVHRGQKALLVFWRTLSNILHVSICTYLLFDSMVTSFSGNAFVSELQDSLWDRPGPALEASTPGCTCLCPHMSRRPFKDAQSSFFEDIVKFQVLCSVLLVSSYVIGHRGQGVWARSKLCWFIFSFFRAARMAYGSSQARGWIGAVAAGLHHSTAMPDPSSVSDLHHSLTAMPDL